MQSKLKVIYRPTKMIFLEVHPFSFQDFILRKTSTQKHAFVKSFFYRKLEGMNIKHSLNPALIYSIRYECSCK